jgi:hypothetical protein
MTISMIGVAEVRTWSDGPTAGNCVAQLDRASESGKDRDKEI